MCRKGVTFPINAVLTSTPPLKSFVLNELHKDLAIQPLGLKPLGSLGSIDYSDGFLTP